MEVPPSVGGGAWASGVPDAALAATISRVQAARRDAHLPQEAQDGQTFDHLQSHLQMMRGVLTSLEMCHTQQSLQVVENVRRAQQIRDQATIYRQQQSGLMSVISKLTKDFEHLRGVMQPAKSDLLVGQRSAAALTALAAVSQHAVHQPCHAGLSLRAGTARNASPLPADSAAASSMAGGAPPQWAATAPTSTTSATAATHGTGDAAIEVRAPARGLPSHPHPSALPLAHNPMPPPPPNKTHARAGARSPLDRRFRKETSHTSRRHRGDARRRARGPWGARWGGRGRRCSGANASRRDLPTRCPSHARPAVAAPASHEWRGEPHDAYGPVSDRA
jgi:hypothetical protein